MVAAGRQRRGFGALRKLPSGRYQASFVGPDLQRYTADTTFTAKTDAEGWLWERRREIEDGTWQAPAAAQAARKRDQRAETFEAYATHWVANRTNDHGEPLRPSTRTQYEGLLDKYLLPTLGELRLTDITKDVVRDWYHDTDVLNRKATPRAASKAYGLFRAIMNSAVDEGLISASPVHLRGAGYAPKRRQLEPASLQELDVIVANMPEQHRLQVLLASWCAMRYGEIAELRRKDVRISRKADAATGTVRIRRAVVFLTGDVRVGPPKTDAGIRDVAIPPHILPAVEDHLERFAQKGAEGLLFPSTLGKHQWPSVVEHHFRVAREFAGRPELRFHDLRHTGAVMAAQQGATLADLQARLGHSTANAALLYQHTAKGRDQLIAERLSQLAEPGA